jgi:small subunit ribosomal protein S18
VRMMQSFVTEQGKIVPRRISGTCAHHQRKLTTSVKRARNLALVGYVSMGQ